MLQALSALRGAASDHESAHAALATGLIAPGVLNGEAAQAAMVRLARERKLERPEYSSDEVKLPWELGVRPLASCRSKEARARAPEADERQARLDAAADTYCDAGLGDFVEIYVDPGFAASHARLADKDGWLGEAFMTYYTATQPKQEVVGEEDLLLQSIHHFSERPIVVVNYGSRVPKTWTPERYPNLVLMHAKKSTADPVAGLSFNLNKINCMMFTKIRTGMALDADQFASRGLDVMFQRAAEETTKEYPYPVLPVHWMTKDPESDDMAQHPANWLWSWTSKDTPGPKQTQRWSHAHPTWTFYALPWMAKWTSFVLAPSKTDGPEWLKPQGFWSDEPLLNVAAWADGLAKQWCKYDLTSPYDYADYLRQDQGVLVHPDKKYYPKGIPKVFFTAHAAKDPENSYGWLEKLWDDGEKDKRLVIYYDHKWFGSGKSLKEYDPSLRCII